MPGYELSGDSSAETRLLSETENEHDIESVENQVPSTSNVRQNAASGGPPADECDAIKAVQWGHLDRLRELIDSQEAHPDMVDGDGCSLLHWAAINNRCEIVNFLCSRGADVNATGGVLSAPPLHWAVRQGHLRVTTVLIERGARAADTLDVEGFGALHVAAQFGHTPVVAYLVAKGAAPVDHRDKSGMTPAMWAAQKVYNDDPLKMLITLGADVSLTENQHGNTPLHWAIAHRNHCAVNLLLKANAPLDARNKNGDTPLVAAEHSGDKWVQQKVLNAAKVRHIVRSSYLERCRLDKRFTKHLNLLAPFPITLLAYMLIAGGMSLWMKLLCAALLALCFWKFFDFFWDENVHLLLPLGVFLAVSIAMQITFVFVEWPYVGTLPRMYFMIYFVVDWAVLLKIWLGDPGYVPRNYQASQAQCDAIVRLAESPSKDGLLAPSSFCTTCLVPRPVRSKHCNACDRCVRVFDHHCPWVGNCVAGGNHRLFVLHLVLVACALLLPVYGAIQYLIYECGSISIRSAFLCAPWPSALGAKGLVHFFWVSGLALSQLYQAALAVTTNERINAYRYKHFQQVQPPTARADKPGWKESLCVKSPFSRGYCRNLVNFFCTDPLQREASWQRDAAIVHEV